jgi:hypothetical protein
LIPAYLNALKERLLSDPKVASFQIRRERAGVSEGYWRGIVIFSDRSRLEFSEYFQVATGETIQIVTYSYHWAQENGDCIKRWDNTPHHPELAGFPFHVHTGKPEIVSASEPRCLQNVLDEIMSELQGQ